jgi:hypothetical protein
MELNSIVLFHFIIHFSDNIGGIDAVDILAIVKRKGARDQVLVVIQYRYANDFISFSLSSFVIRNDFFFVSLFFLSLFCSTQH